MGTRRHRPSSLYKRALTNDKTDNPPVYRNAGLMTLSMDHTQRKIRTTIVFWSPASRLHEAKDNCIEAHEGAGIMSKQAHVPCRLRLRLIFFEKIFLLHPYACWPGEFFGIHYSAQLLCVGVCSRLRSLSYLIWIGRKYHHWADRMELGVRILEMDWVILDWGGGG